MHNTTHYFFLRLAEVSLCAVEIAGAGLAVGEAIVAVAAGVAVRPLELLAALALARALRTVARGIRVLAVAGWMERNLFNSAPICHHAKCDLKEN